MQQTGLFAPSAGRGHRHSIAGTLGAACVLMFGVVLITVLSLDRSETAMIRFLEEKGSALITALESGVRSGTRSSGAGIRLQFLVEELADRPDVRFIAVTMPDGTILAHSNPVRVGEVLSELGGREISPSSLERLHTSETPAWTIMNMEGSQAFVVYKMFFPLPRRGMGGHHSDRLPPPGPIPYVFLGLDLGPLESAQWQNRKRAMLIGGVVLLAGVLALLALHALDRIRASRRGQRVAEAIAEELAVTLPDGLILLDERGRIARLNSAAARLLRIAEQQTCEGRKPEDVLPGALVEVIVRLAEGTVLPETEITLQDGDETRYLGVSGGHVNEGNEGRLGTLLFLRDMTAVRLLEAEVRRREKLAAVGNLAAGVAHELRNPLSSIKGYATYFSGRFPEGSADKEAAEVMVREADRLNRAIGDLIGLSRPTDIHPRPTDMRGLLEDTLRLLGPDTSGQKVSVQLELPEDVPLAAVDPDRIRQVMLNLCLNAIEAMPDGGLLTLSICPDTGNMLRLEVRDTGTGISAAALPHIFDPYFTTKGQGTGLGLATVHKIIEAHGGSLSVTSEPGRTVFRFWLPLVM